MNEKKTFLSGDIRLSELNGFEDTVKQGVRGCFIPYDANPSLFVGTSKKTGQTFVSLNILVRECSAGQSGQTHFVKLNVSKANRERFAMSQDAVNSLRIIGNLTLREPSPKGGYRASQNPQTPYQGAAPYAPQYPQGGAYYQRGPAPAGAPHADMPDFGTPQQQAGW